MTAQSTFHMNDLVLRLAGGKRDGELIPVKTNKCFLGTEESSGHGGAGDPQCAIFRGPNGAAVRSYGDDILVNGVATTVHWLQEGDRIEFPNSMSVEVAQLGWVEESCDQHEAAVQEEVECQTNNICHENTEESTTQADCDPFGCQDAYFQPKTKSTDVSESEMTVKENCQQETQNNQSDERLDLFDSQIQDIQAQNSRTEQRFDQLDGQLSNLAEQLSQLVSLASGNVANENSPAETGDCSPVEAEDVSSSGDFYSYADDDDEKIMTFDSEKESEAEPKVEASTIEVEITDAKPELDSNPQSEMESRLSEMERVFGGCLEDDDSESTDSESTEPTMDHTADEPTESFDTPTHGLNENNDSSADHSTTEACEPEELSSLASQLLNDLESEGPLVDDEKVVEVNDEFESEVEEIEEEAENDEVAPAQSQSSVADLLARMKADGQWDGVPDGDEPVEPVDCSVEPVVELDDESNESFEESGDDVQDYMSQLLNRMRGDQPASQPKPAAAKAPVKPKEKKSTEEAEFVAPVNPLKAEEFKPSSKAQKIELSKMRELANSTSRRAVHASEQIRRKELGYLQIGIAVCSFAMAIYYLLINSEAFFDTGFCVGVICIGIAGFLGYRFYSTMKYNEMIELAPKKEAKPEVADKSEAEVAPE